MQFSISERPRLLRDIKGQDPIIKDLIKRQMNPHTWPKAMLFKGKYGVGKSTAAMAVALSMQCPNINDVGEPCLECASCKSIIDETYDRDTHMIDGSLLGQKDYVTEQLDLIKIAPMQDKKRVFIIEEADQLSKGAINAFHKILEEPTENVHFILLAMSNSIPPSIQSRCQVYNFKDFSIKDTMFALRAIMEDHGLWDNPDIPQEFKLEGLATIANASRGSFREAVQYLERCLSSEFYTEQEIRDNLGIIDESTLLATIHSFLERDTSVWYDLFSVDVKEFYNLAMNVLTFAYLYKTTGIVKNEFHESSTKAVANHKNFIALYNAFNSLRESSKTFIRRMDLIDVLSSYWEKTKPVTNGIPVRTRVRS